MVNPLTRILEGISFIEMPQSGTDVCASKVDNNKQERCTK